MNEDPSPIKESLFRQKFVESILFLVDSGDLVSVRFR